MLLILLNIGIAAKAAYILIPMDESQSNHLKAYGIAYWILTKDVGLDWMLNYKGGSFMVKHLQAFENECIIRGVSYQVISDAQANDILNLIASPSSNMDVMKLEKFPEIAVYSPKSKQPWDDAITIYSTFDDYQNDAYVTTADQIYFAFAIINDGEASLENSFGIEILLNNSLEYSFSQTRSAASPLNPGFFTFYSNVDNTNIQNLGAGVHSLQLILDGGNAVSESDDTDNSYIRYFFIDDASNPSIVWDGSTWSNTVGPTTNTNDNIVFLSDYIFQNDNPGPNVGELVAVGDITLVGDVNVIIEESMNFQVHGAIESTGKITVKEGGSLFVYGDIINNGEILVESGGSFLLSGGSNYSGNDMIIRRNTRYPDGKYSFVGSPVVQSTDIIGNSLGSYVYKFDETVPYGSNSGFNKWISASTEQLTQGRGYTQADQKRITFEGQPNQGPITYAGTYTSDDGLHEGFNLVANPYATAISVADFLTANTNIEGAIYLWDDNGSNAVRGSSADYIVANGIGATNTTPAGGESRYNQFVGSAQGFFVKLINGSDVNIDFTENMQSSGRNYDDNFFRSDIVPRLRVNLSDEDDLFKQTLFGLIEDADEAIKDRRYDAPAINPLAEFGLYSLKNERALSIQGISFEWEILPLQMNIGADGDYLLSIERESLEKDIFLHDRSTGHLHDFNTGNYGFTSEAGIHADRFEILSSPILSVNSKKGDLIYAIDKMLFFRVVNGEEKRYKVFNLNGSHVQTLRVNGTATFDLSRFETGVYLVSDGTKTTKIVLR